MFETLTLRLSTFFVICGAILVGFVAPASAGEGARYEIDPSHTHAQFSVRRFGFNDVIGNFSGVRGYVVLNTDDPAASSVEVEIAIDSLASGDATRDEHLRGEFWFNAAEHPVMQYRSTSVELTGESSAVIQGDLTFLGVTKNVPITVTLNKRGADPATKREAAGFSATANLSRADFGMSIAGKLIGDEVAIRIEALAHKVEN